MNYEQARTNMVKQQLRTWLVLNTSLLAVVADLPREIFVPEKFQALAYADTAIDMGNHRTMLTPAEVGRAVQALNCQHDEKALCVGMVDGYLAAVLAKQVLHVYGVESDEAILKQQTQNFSTASIDNVTLLAGDYQQGWQQNAPYDVILLSGSVPSVSDEILESLTVGGRLFAIIGDQPVMEATIYHRQEQNQWAKTKLFETSRPRLPGVKEPDPFEF